MDNTLTITIITANFYPEDTAIGLYTSQFANYLKNEGYAVQVITGFPYYHKSPIYCIHEVWRFNVFHYC